MCAAEKNHFAVSHFFCIRIHDGFVEKSFPVQLFLYSFIIRIPVNAEVVISKYLAVPFQECSEFFFRLKSASRTNVQLRNVIGNDLMESSL